MVVIYRIHNNINEKNYIGQSRNWKKRINHYRSNPFNKNCKGYNRPINAAIRKYGIDNFTFFIVESFDDNVEQKILDDKEKFYIKYYHSLVNEHGYNIEYGGHYETKDKISYEEKLNMSTIFSSEEIKDIQKLLIEKKSFSFIMNKYKGRLGSSFLSNINCGLNFKNDKWTYPLQEPFKSVKFTREQVEKIRQRIKDGVPYNQIAKEFDIKSVGFLTGVNNGKYYYDKNETYPLCDKSRYGKNQKMVDGVIHDLLYTSLTMKKIAEKNNCSISTVKNIKYGRAHKNPKLTYPLISIVSTISG